MAENKTDPRVKEFYDYAQGTVDEQAILDKFNAATRAQFDVQREQNRQAENKFYNQMYNTQRTAMDTIRKSNAAAVSSGASRGVQAANELSALLGLQQESVQSATEIAQQNRQTAQEETAAVLENVLKAYQQASQERSQLTQQGIEADSLTATEQQAQAAQTQAQTERDKYLLDLKVNDPDKYYSEVAKEANATDFVNMTPEQLQVNMQTANNAIAEMSTKLGYNWNDWALMDVGESGNDKAKKIKTSLQNLYTAYGLSVDSIDNTLKGLTDLVKSVSKSTSTGGRNLAMAEAAKQYLQDQFNAAYKLKYTLSK